MSGKVPPSSRVALRQAVALYRDFTGMEPESITTHEIVIPKAVLVIGETDEVWYTAVRDQVEERYRHRFRKRSRPLLCASADGKTLVILGGEFEFTDRGIVDK